MTDDAPELAEAGRRADRLLRRALWVALLCVVLLSLGSPLAFWDVLGLPIFLVLLPGLAVAQLPLLRHVPIERREVYLGSLATIVAVGVVGGALLTRLGGGRDVGGEVEVGPALAAWTVGLTLAALAVIGSSLFLDRAGSDERTRFLLRLLPRTPPERRLFALLSVAAGVGEEIAYRGYALAALPLVGVGPWTAAVGSSAAFGLLHAYQGPIGIARTAIVGLIFAAGVLLTGSLLPAVVAHAVVDLVAGLVLGPWLLRRHADDRAGPLDPPAGLG